MKIKCLLIAAFFANLSVFTGCDNCPPANSDEDGLSGIYYTARPLGMDAPYIFGVSPDGSDYREIFKDGMLYSPPSKGNIGVFIRNDSIVYRYNASTGTIIDSPHVKNDFFDSPDFVVKQPEGNNIKNFLVNSSDKLYYYWNDNGGEVSTQRNGFLQGTIPSFSPDGKWIAYYTGTDIETDARIGLWNQGTGAYSEYDAKLKTPIGKPGINWAPGGSEILYTISENEANNVIIRRNTDGTENRYEVYDNGGYMPAMNEKGDSLAYVDKTGRIWIMEVPAANETPKQWPVVETGPGETCLYPAWSKNSKYILYTRFYDGDFEKGGRLELRNLDNGTTIVLANNAFRGFWSIK